MGFREDLQFILETTPADRRTLLFSATLPKAIVTLATHYQKDALRIATRSDTAGHADIEYRAIRIAGNKIERAVVNLLRFMDPPGALVFCNTRNAVRHMEAQLTGARLFLRGAVGRTVAKRAQPCAAGAARRPRQGLRRHRRGGARHRPAQPQPGDPCRPAQRRPGAAASQRPHRPRRQEGRQRSCWCRRHAAAAPRRCWAAPASPPSGAMRLRPTTSARWIRNGCCKIRCWSKPGSDDDLAMADELLKSHDARASWRRPL